MYLVQLATAPDHRSRGLGSDLRTRPLVARPGVPMLWKNRPIPVFPWLFAVTGPLPIVAHCMSPLVVENQPGSLMLFLAAVVVALGWFAPTSRVRAHEVFPR